MARQADPDLAERRRRQILDAAVACFRRRGFHQTSMQEICSEAALSAGALYRYFPSKSDIIAAIAEDDYWRAREPMFDAIENGPDPIAAICRLADHALETCGGEASLVADVIAESMRDPQLAQRFIQHERELRRRLGRAIARAQQRGLVTLTMPAERAAGVVILMLDGLVLRAAGLGEAHARQHVNDFRVAIEQLFAPPPVRPRRADALMTEETDR